MPGSKAKRMQIVSATIFIRDSVLIVQLWTIIATATAATDLSFNENIQSTFEISQPCTMYNVHAQHYYLSFHSM